MKALPLLLAALLLPASAALAQTVLPSGAVAPAGAVLGPSGGTVPGTVPGSQPVVTPDMRDAGPRRTKRHDEDAPGMTHRERRQLRKIGKVKYGADATKQAGKK